MKYIPGLIPPDKKVLPGYFTETPASPSFKNSSTYVLLFIGAVIVFVAGLSFLKHPLLTLLFTLIGLVLLPGGRSWIEKQFRFRLTVTITASFITIVSICMAPLFLYYQGVDKIEVAVLQAQLEKQKAVDLAVAKEHQRQDDSVQLFLTEARLLEKTGKLEQAMGKVELAASFAQTDSAKSTLSNVRSYLEKKWIIALVKQGKYEAALPQLATLMEADSSGDKDLHYYRAVCYSKNGQIQEAVNDLKPLLTNGNKAADRLYDQINPITRRVIGHVTRCNDGSTSQATGRGACSHHGGVANWNDPVYEESRKYE
jgi:tetratricopeptide (TPR) repeat protein